MIFFLKEQLKYEYSFTTNLLPNEGLMNCVCMDQFDVSDRQQGRF